MGRCQRDPLQRFQSRRGFRPAFRQRLTDYKRNGFGYAGEPYERTSGALSFFYNWGRHKINDGYHAGEEPQTSLFHSKDLMMGVSWYQSAELYTGNRLTLGFDYQHFGGESWNEAIADGARTPGVDKKQDEFAGYVDFRQDIGTWLSLNVGLRVDHHSHVGTELVPQGGLAFHLPKNAELKAMVSKGFRNPTIREMYMFPPQNPDLKPERMMNYELSYTQHLLDGALSYGVNLYYINGDNLIMTTPVDGRPTNSQLGRNRELGSGREHCLPHQPPMERKRQLQLGAHGTSGHLGSRAQAVCRRDFRQEAGACRPASSTSKGYIPPSTLPVPRTSCFGTCVPATACARMPRSLCAARTSWHNATKSWLAIPCRKPHSWEESISISNPI